MTEAQMREEFEKWAEREGYATSDPYDELGRKGTPLIAWLAWDAAYARGLRAGMERAAEICESLVLGADGTPNDCAAAIRGKRAEGHGADVGERSAADAER